MTTPQTQHSGPSGDFENGLPLLPPYVRSLLRIRTQVAVTLAETTLSLKSILEIAPGAIIQFEKACDQPLTLSVGDRNIAVGDAVKVGDKFGLRITSMVLPDERFLALRGKREASPSQAPAS